TCRSCFTHTRKWRMGSGKHLTRRVMSALGQKQTLVHFGVMSALPPKADIDRGAINERWLSSARGRPVACRAHICYFLASRPPSFFAWVSSFGSFANGSNRTL